MSFGDEGAERPEFFDPLTPNRKVIPLRQSREYGPPARACSKCGDPTREPGCLCSTCRDQQPPVSAAFVQATVADTIRQLEREAARGSAPLALPVAQALSNMRRLFDSLNPIVDSLHIGIVKTEDDLFYAYPYSSSERLGPYGSRSLADHALVQHALEYGNWDTELEG